VCFAKERSEAERRRVVRRGGRLKTQVCGAPGWLPSTFFDFREILAGKLGFLLTF